MRPGDASPAGGAQLAHGELSAHDAAELAFLKQRIEDLAGFRCNGYKERCLRRRIAVRMRAREVHSYAAYGALLDNDAAECRRLIDTVTINVSKFFRNREVWSVLEEKVLPQLARIEGPEVRIWSAGCAAGEEIYTVAMLLLEQAEREKLDLRRFRLLATDIDHAALADAQRGEYGDFALSETAHAMRERWFEGPGLRRVRDEVRRLVEFRELDLIRDPYPDAQHLILCRNVVIYFERPVQTAVFDRLHGALAPGGHLLLGKVEALFGEQLRRYRSIAGRERLFQRP